MGSSHVRRLNTLTEAHCMKYRTSCVPAPNNSVKPTPLRGAAYLNR
jgi:hypothetical protein